MEVKPDVLKDNAKSERKKKKEELKAKKAAESKAADFSDLPEMKLNLSESDSSDDEEMRPKAETEHNTVQAHTEPSEMRGESNKVSKMSESEEEAECSKSKEQHSQSIWDNFKLAQQLEPKPEVKPEAPAKVFLHVVQSDHDYSRMYRKPGDVEEIKEVVPVFAPKKSSPKKKHKLAKPPGYSSSSSDSSSDSDSSSCCSKSNCSCSSSSSGSSSSSSDEGKKNKKGKKEFSSKSNDAIDVVATDATDAIPKGPDDIIYESDLVTDETETDEDFYDEHPQKLPNNNLLLAEKRRLLLLQSCGDYDGIVENSRPSTPSLPPDEISEKVEKKKLKIKKKKRERKSSKSGGSLASPIKRIHSPALHQSYNAYQDSQQYYNNSNAIYEQGGFHHSYPSAPKVPKMELHQEAEIRHLLQSNHQQPVLPIMQMQLDRERYTPSNSATSSRKNSECGDIKRSQRRRVPNRFYGYTSDDDSFSAQAQTTNNPFKPVPPPNLTWRKEDLPSGSKMRMVTPSSAKRSEFNYDDVSEYAYEPTEPPKSAPARVPISQQHLIFNDSDSSENALQINHEPRKRQRRDVTPKPPIPKLKLSIGLDNKIKKRRIQSTSTVSAQKRRKVEPIQNKRQNSEVLSFTTTSLPDSLLYDSNSSGIGAGIGLTSLLPPSQLLKSPHFDSTPSYHESYYQQQQKLTQRQLEHQGQQSKKQSLEDAIQKTQQYYRQFNHQQIRPQNQQEVKEGERLYCYCRAAYDEASEMIGCDGDNCQIEWFHFECVGILVAPKGKWYCPECQKQHMH